LITLFSLCIRTKTSTQQNNDIKKQLIHIGVCFQKSFFVTLPSNGFVLPLVEGLMPNFIANYKPWTKVCEIAEKPYQAIKKTFALNKLIINKIYVKHENFEGQSCSYSLHIEG